MNLFGSTTPGTVDSGDGSAYTLGTVFRSSVDGQITGIRFYKATDNFSPHTVALYDEASETLLASKVTAGETASGWQYQAFDTPVDISAGTLYIAAYHTPNGHYSRDANFFTSSGHTNGSLEAVAASVVPNGRYGGSSVLVFPSSSFNDTNYWVDVEFTADGGGIEGDLAADETATADTFAATGGLGSNGIRLTLRDTDTGALAANLTGLIVSVRENSDDNATLYKTTSETTNASGVLELASAVIGDLGDYVYVTVEKADHAIAALYRIQVIDLNA
jgi:hypothetical protein